jgi:hypothetical protein
MKDDDDDDDAEDADDGEDMTVKKNLVKLMMVNKKDGDDDGDEEYLGSSYREFISRLFLSLCF